MRLARFFLYSAAAVLLLTASAKFASGAGHAAVLARLDPLTGLEFRNLFFVVGGIEAAIALVCLFVKQTWIPASLVAWLATSFLGYRMYLAATGYHAPCRCLGNLTDGLHIPPEVAEAAMKTVLTYLLAGGYATVACLWLEKRKSAPAPEISGEAIPAV